jgi:hypothetical protein
MGQIDGLAIFSSIVANRLAGWETGDEILHVSGGGQRLRLWCNLASILMAELGL